MEPRNAITPPATGKNDDDTRDDRREEKAGKHIVDNLLPPGIDFDEAKDPGSKHPPKAPTDNRS